MRETPFFCLFGHSSLGLITLANFALREIRCKPFTRIPPFVIPRDSVTDSVYETNNQKTLRHKCKSRGRYQLPYPSTAACANCVPYILQSEWLG